MKKFVSIFLLAFILAHGIFAGGSKESAKTTLTIESYRTDDLLVWNDTIIPAFAKRYPNITIIFAPTPTTEYDAALSAKLEGGTAGDLITTRPFDASLELYNQGYLESLNDLKGISNFSDVAKSAWQTDDATTVFAVPVASVIHGFFYNKDIFQELGLSEPKTEAEFFNVLEVIKKDGQYTPLAIGTSDQWEVSTMGFQNIGPNYWSGETGRKALLDGTGKFTDSQYVKVWEQLAKWTPYLGSSFGTRSYLDSQSLFSLGKAAIYPAGSWEISLFNSQADFNMGAFPPPLPAGQDTLYISDHTDIAIGLNPASPNKDAARTFLNWVSSAEFAELYSNALPGSFSLSNASITLKDPLANTIIGWRKTAEPTIRNSYQILSRGTPNLELELWSVSAQVINGTLSPSAAAQQTQSGLDSWYTP